MSAKRNTTKSAKKDDETRSELLPDGHGGYDRDTIFDDLQERQAHRQPESQSAAVRDSQEISGRDQTRSHGNRPKVSRDGSLDHN